MRLGLQAFTDSNESTMLADWSPRASNLQATTDQHGFGNLTCFIKYSLEEAFRIYDWASFAHVVLSAGGWRIFEGRIEDRRLVDGGLEIGAFGYWRSMFDAPYTVLWSDKRYAGWFPSTIDDLANRTPERFELDNNNRLYIAPRNGETMDTSTQGALQYYNPDKSDRYITEIDFDYELVGDAGGNWRGRLVSYQNGYTNSAVEWSLDSDGTTQSASTTVDLTNTSIEILEFKFWRLSSATYSGDTGAYYFKITNLRVKAWTEVTIYANKVVNKLVEFINSINSNQLSSSTSLIEAPNVDLTDEIYEDRLPAEIALELANRGDDSSPPELYEVGVWEGQRLHFRKKGKYGMDWYTDIARLEIDSSLDTLYNDAYSVYQNARGQTLRTATNVDSESKAQYGITRRGARHVSSTSATVATTFRDAFISDNKDVTPRARVVTIGIYNASGGRVPLWMIRAGDTLTVRNLPPGSGTAVDKVRKFRIRRTTYDVDNDILTPEPELEAPSLEFLVAANLSRLESFIR